MKAQDIKALSLEELKEKLAELKSNMAKTKLNHAISTIENPLSIRGNRRDIARVSTELTKRKNAEKK
jgi:large subunit ribosomal protein L29